MNTKPKMKPVGKIEIDILDRGRNLLGFHGEWANARTKSTSYSMSGGQGMGNMWLQFNAKHRSGKEFNACVDMAELMRRLCDMADKSFE